MPIKEISGCIGCKSCIEACPTDVIAYNKDTEKAEIVHQQDCQICHLCRLNCPVNAITIDAEKHIPVIVSWR